MDAFEIAAVKTARRREIEAKCRAMADAALMGTPTVLKTYLDTITLQLNKLTALEAQP